MILGAEAKRWGSSGFFFVGTPGDFNANERKAVPSEPQGLFKGSALSAAEAFLRQCPRRAGFFNRQNGSNMKGRCSICDALPQAGRWLHRPSPARPRNEGKTSKNTKSKKSGTWTEVTRAAFRGQWICLTRGSIHLFQRPCNRDTPYLSHSREIFDRLSY